MKKLVVLSVTMAFLFIGLAAVFAGSARDTISIVGSSTVYPFATVVAERFGKGGQYKTPKIESTGSGGGFKLFCAGVGVEHPDITNASRRMKDTEFETCAKNGVTEIVEVKVGYDGIVVANAKSAPLLKLTRKALFLALAKEVPDPERFGVVKFDANQKAEKIVEKPQEFLSNHALVGLYIYDNRVVKVAENLKPSARGEKEIVDLHNWYLDKGELEVEIIKGEWIDAGTFDSLLRANNFIAKQRKNK